MQIVPFIVHLPESSTVTGLLLLLDFELSPFFSDVAFLQQNKKYRIKAKNIYMDVKS